jgi:uncharacterized protein YwgA
MGQLNLAAVVAAAKKVEGRVKLQKMMYLLQKKGVDLGYSDFGLLLYGPYSDSLAADLDRVTGVMLEEAQEHVDFVDRFTGKAAIRYVYRPRKALADPLLRLLEERFGGRGKDLIELVGLLNSKSSPVLELVATALYFREDEGLTDPDAMWESVLRLKGHLRRYLPEAKSVLSELDVVELG